MLDVLGGENLKDYRSYKIRLAYKDVNSCRLHADAQAVDIPACLLDSTDKLSMSFCSALLAWACG